MPKKKLRVLRARNDFEKRKRKACENDSKDGMSKKL